MDRLHTTQRVLVKEDEDGRVHNRHGTVARVCTDGERAWVLLDAKGGGPGSDKVRVLPGGCAAPTAAPRAERRAAAWEEKEAGKGSGVGIEQFGRDHWSTFAYLETRIVDHGGIPDRAHMRCHVDRHPLLVGPAGDGSVHPTRLRGAARLAHHDDWDCCADLERAGLMINVGTALYPRYALTDRGVGVASRLRQHKASGGSFSDFVPQTGL